MRRRKRSGVDAQSPRPFISSPSPCARAQKKLNAPRRSPALPRRSSSFASPHRFVFYCLCLFFISSLVIFAQSGDEDSSSRARNLHQWGAVTLFHGLPSDRVRAIAQTDDGAMWFGTDRGLARYDGRRTQTIVSENLPAGRVLALKHDADGALWIGTDAGATRLADGEFQFIKETAGHVITAIITPERGRALLASEEGALLDCRSRPDNSLAVQTIIAQTSQNTDTNKANTTQFSALAFAGDTLFVGTRNRGLLIVENGAAKEISSRPRLSSINAIERDGGGHLWFGAKAGGGDSGLYDASDPSRPQRVGAGSGTVTSLAFDSRGRLWIGTVERGAFCFDGAQEVKHFTFEGTAGGLRSDTILSVLVDREGVVWFGTDRGVCRYDPQSPQNETVATSNSGNFVRTLFQTRDGRVLCGTNRGLFVFAEEIGAWQSVKEFADKTIYAVSEDAQGNLLVGSSSGLYTHVQLRSGAILEKDEGRIETEDERRGGENAVRESVRALRAFQGATYVAVFGRGVERLNGDNRTLIFPDERSDPRLREVTSLHADAGRLWIGTARDGVFVFDGRQTRREPAFEKLKGRAVWSMDGGEAQGLWLATEGGLYRYVAGELTEIAPSADVRQVVASDRATSDANVAGAASSGVWCATSGGGLLRVRVDEEFGVLVSRMDVEQGLSSQKVFALLRLKSHDGDESLLVGTTRGIVRYAPGNTTPSLVPVRVLSRRVHQPDELRRGIELDYPQNSLAFDVLALSTRTYPEQFQYAFLLRDVGGRVLKRKLAPDSGFLMENLPPGKYSVEARAFTKDLVASEPLAFEFTVTAAPFPRMIVALSVLLALSAVALLWAFVEHRRIKRANLTIAGVNRELAGARLQLANEAERERRRIARDLHDQTLADLRHLLMLTDKLRAEREDGHAANSEIANSDDVSSDAAILRREIEAVSDEIRRICEDLSPSALENVGLAAALEWALANAVAHAGCNFDYEFVCAEDFDEEVNLPPGERIQIYRIAQEAINNVCRHAGATRVRLTVRAEKDGDFLLTLEDNGRDFAPPNGKAKHGRGLANIRARASLIESDISWSKTESGETLFALRKINRQRTV